MECYKNDGEVTLLYPAFVGFMKGSTDVGYVLVNMA